MHMYSIMHFYDKKAEDVRSWVHKVPTEYMDTHQDLLQSNVFPYDNYFDENDFDVLPDVVSPTTVQSSEENILTAFNLSAYENSSSACDA
jgi:hypothetical protein